MNEKYEIVKFKDDKFQLDVKIDFNKNTIWLSIGEISLLFNKSRTVISKHIKNIILENKLEETSVCAFFAHTANDGKEYQVKYYKLEIILLIGHRVKSNRVFLFKNWIETIFDEKKPNNSEIKFEIVKFIDNKIEIDVNIDTNEDTVWLSQQQMSKLFETSKQNISLHINNIFKEKELDFNSVVKDYLTTALDGKMYTVKLYNLDVIISVGYRVKSNRGVLFRKWANKVLRKYLMTGFVVNQNRVAVSNDNFNNLVNVVLGIQSNLFKTNGRLNRIEEKVFNKEYGLDKLFFNGEFYDAYSLIQQIFESANQEIIIIDNYIDRTFLDRLVVKKENVKIKIYTNIITSKLLGSDIKSFNSQYGLLEVNYTIKVHDRYIIIDNNKLYHLGHSIKDLGKKIFSISESDSELIPILLKNL